MIFGREGVNKQSFLWHYLSVFSLSLLRLALFWSPSCLVCSPTEKQCIKELLFVNRNFHWSTRQTFIRFPCRKHEPWFFFFFLASLQASAPYPDLQVILWQDPAQASCGGGPLQDITQLLALQEVYPHPASLWGGDEGNGWASLLLVAFFLWNQPLPT